LHPVLQFTKPEYAGDRKRPPQNGKGSILLIRISQSIGKPNADSGGKADSEEQNWPRFSLSPEYLDESIARERGSVSPSERKEQCPREWKQCRYKKRCDREVAQV
jgi:hypothetical protein